MVIDDFNLVSVSLSPHKADTPLVIDPNAVLALPVATKRFKPVARRDGQVTELRRGIKLGQLPLRDPLEGPKAFHPLPPVEAFGILRTEGPDHLLIV